MSTKITRVTAVAAVLAATAIAAPSVAANPPRPAGINAGLGPSSGLATIAALNADAQPIESTVPAATVPAQGRVSAGLTMAAASADSPSVAAPTASAGGFDWGDAGITAAGMVTLLGLGAGSVVLIRRSGRAGQTVG